MVPAGGKSPQSFSLEQTLPFSNSCQDTSSWPTLKVLSEVILGSGVVAILPASSQDCSWAPKPPRLPPPCVYRAMQWSLWLQRLDEFKGTLRGDNFQCLQDHFDWNRAERNPTIHSKVSKHSHPRVNVWTYTLWQICPHSAEENGVFSALDQKQFLIHSFGLLVKSGDWQFPPEEQGKSCSYLCLKIERDKDRAWVPTASLNRHWVTSELCSLFWGTSLTGRKQAGEAENRARKVSFLKDEDLAAEEVFSEWSYISHPHPTYT